MSTQSTDVQTGNLPTLPDPSGNQGQPVEGSQLMGVPQQATQPVQPSVNVEDQLRTLQAQQTQTQQQLVEAQRVNNLLLQQALKSQNQQPTQPAQRTLLDLEGDDFVQAMQNDPKRGIMSIAEQLAERKATELVKPIQEQLQATQMIINRQMVDNQLAQMEATYKKIDPNYSENLDKAVDLAITQFRDFGRENPAQALSMAYQAVLGQRMMDPSFVQNLRNSILQTSNQNEVNKNTAGVTMSGTTVNAPYNPAPNNTPQSQDQLARQIALYNDPSAISGMQGLQVSYNPF